MSKIEITDLSLAEPGEYVVLDIDWSNHRVGKYIHDRDIIAGSVVVKDKDGAIMFDKSRYDFDEVYLKAMRVVKHDDFEKLKVVYWYGGV